jgi:HD-GYP domain-containing protein (c-di-GMP phosphodiesterase class II)
MERILESVRWNTGHHFDPQVVEAFWKVLEAWNPDAAPAWREGIRYELPKR